MIYEVVVYCGATKVFRVLNLSTGTVYSCDYDTFDEAFASIKDGEIRSGKVVKRTTLEEINKGLS